MSDAASIVLCLNGGSSSLKFAVFEMTRDAERRLVAGAIEGVGTEQGRATLRAGEAHIEQEGRFEDAAAALDAALALLDAQNIPKPSAVGHRVVHSGTHPSEPALVDAALLEALKAVVPIAPLHMPGALAAILAVKRRSPELRQVVCFDTAFHRALPPVAYRLPLPDAIYASGIRRYGFHGLSYEYVMSVLGKERPSRVVIAHLGSGSSLVAVKDGVSVDTTMGFTPTGGVMMGTRTGELDPGVLLFLARERGYSTAALEKLVEHESGLLAIGGTSDVKTLLERARAPGGETARLALDMFAYAVKKQIGAYAAALGGLELLVFTGGVGEHSPDVRAAVCRELSFLGVVLDDAKNRSGSPSIGAASARSAVRVIETDEEVVIARHVRALV